jgi:hypothetical protein
MQALHAYRGSPVGAMVILSLSALISKSSAAGAQTKLLWFFSSGKNYFLTLRNERHKG